MFLLFLLLSCLVKDLAILKTRGMLVQKVWGLIFSLNFSRRLVSWAALLYLLEHRWKLEAINCFFNQCVLTIKLLLVLFYLSLNQRLKSFSKGLYEVGLFWSAVSINLIMEILQVRHPIMNFHLLVLGVLFNATPGGIHKALESLRLFQKKALNSSQSKRSSTA